MALFGGSETELNIVVRLKDEATKALKSVEEKFSAFDKRMQGSVDASQKFALGMAGAGAAVGAFALSAIKSAAGMEQTQIAFETMLGSAEKAKEFYGDLVKFASKTPFELKGLETASKQLLAYGFQQKEILPNLKALGDIASGVGMDKLPNLIMAFGQVKAATKLTGMELRQFTEAGVPLLDMLAKQFGKPVSAIQEMVSAGEIGFPAVQKAMEDLTGEGGRFNNLMDKQAKSLGGMWSNLADAWEQFLRGQGAELLEWGKKLVQMMIDIVNNHLPRWIALVKEIIDWFAKHKEALLLVAGAIVGMLTPAIYAALTAFYLWAATMAPWALGGAAVGALVAGIIWIVKNWDDLKARLESNETIKAALDAIREAFNSVWQVVREQLWPAMQDLWATIETELWPALVKLWEAVQPLLPGLELMAKIVGGILLAAFIVLVSTLTEMLKVGVTVLTWITDFTTFMVKVATVAIKAFKGEIDSLVESFKSVVDWINKAMNAWNSYRASGASLNPFSSSFKLPGFATGGIVPGPVGTPVPIMAHGQEQVIPASQAGGSTGNVTVNIINPSVRSDDDIRRIRQEIDRYFRPLMINNKITA